MRGHNSAGLFAGQRRELAIIAVLSGGLCCLLVGMAGMGLVAYRQYTQNRVAVLTPTPSPEATATLTVDATATMLSHLQELATASFFEPFDDNLNGWTIGSEDGDFWTGYRRVNNGHYEWDMRLIRRNLIAWGDYESQPILKDFDAVVDVWLKKGNLENSCYGLLFRAADSGFDDGAYAFSVCDSGRYRISYHVNGEWEALIDWSTSPLIHAGNWNQLEVLARGSDFQFMINGEQIASLKDTRAEQGHVSVFADLYDLTPVTLWFDNFALK